MEHCYGHIPPSEVSVILSEFKSVHMMKLPVFSYSPLSALGFIYASTQLYAGSLLINFRMSENQRFMVQVSLTSETLAFFFFFGGGGWLIYFYFLNPYWK